MPKIPKILTIGSAIQDVFLSNSKAFKTVRIDATHDVTELELGAKIDVNNIGFSSGGGATNASVTFARQGLQAIFFGVIGDDLAGNTIVAELDKENVDTRYVRISDKFNTDYSTVILAPNGERTILTYRGSSTQISAKDFSTIDENFDWIYVSSLSGNLSEIDQIFAIAKKSGAKIMWNPGKKELEQTEKIKALLEDVEILLVNKEEAKMIFSGETSEELAIHGANLVKVTLVTDGAEGVFACDGENLVHCGIYEDVLAIDRTGAGDAFGSGFLSQWVPGAD